MAQPTIDWSGVDTLEATYKTGAAVFTQGDPCSNVLYIANGGVRLSVISHSGKEAIIGTLEAGHFFGEGCMAGQPLRMSSAHTVEPSTIIAVEKSELSRQMQRKPLLAERFLKHMLTRNIRIEEDLIDQLFNDAEKRLARTLLLMARFGEEGVAHRTLPKVSQSVLAEMIGTTRSRVNSFMTKFRDLGFIEYNGALKIHDALLTVLLRDVPTTAPRHPMSPTKTSQK